MKKIKNIVLVLSIVLMMSGCVKSRYTMSINEDKSMDFEAITLVAESLLEGQEVDPSKYNYRGLSAEKLSENGYIGLKITKKYKNIDEISSEDEKEIIISNYTDKDFDDSVLFTVKKGFLKNTYSAKYVFDSNTSTGEDNDNNTFSSLEDEEDDYTVVDTATANTTNDETTGSVDENESNDSLQELPSDSVEDNNEEDSQSPFSNGNYSQLMSETEYKYTVNLPVKVLSSNANTTDNDGKTLLWNLNLGSKNNINFSFQLLNMTNIYILTGGSLLLVIIIIIVIISIIKKKKNSLDVLPKEAPIYTDFDNSQMNNQFNTETTATLPPNSNIGMNNNIQQNNINESTYFEQNSVSSNEVDIPSPEVSIPVEAEKPKFIVPEKATVNTVSQMPKNSSGQVNNQSDEIIQINDKQ